MPTPQLQPEKRELAVKQTTPPLHLLHSLIEISHTQREKLSKIRARQVQSDFTAGWFGESRVDEVGGWDFEGSGEVSSSSGSVDGIIGGQRSVVTIEIRW